MGNLSSAAVPQSLPAFLLLFCLIFGVALGAELNFVTCGSVIKLLNIKHNVRLHSHDVRYGSGSGQQSVTGVSAAEDSNSYWSVRGTNDAFCYRGTSVKCGQTIRLTHVNTGRNLHSHYFASPLSSNQVCDVKGTQGECLQRVWKWGSTVYQQKTAVSVKHSRFLRCATETVCRTKDNKY
uniref:MIR domain-containing protein n=1 Tax=Mola mola TaxID=94237 RepID=A0A3Q4B8K6_MOLML